MTQELLSRFENMSDREILISAVSKIDYVKELFELEIGQIKSRVDRHSAESDELARQDKIDKAKLTKANEDVKDFVYQLEKRVKTLEDRHSSTWETIKNYGSLIGFGSGLYAIIQRVKGQ